MEINSITIIFPFLGFVILSNGETSNKPNFILFLADDMGFGDLQSTGSPLSIMPHISELENNGLKFTQSYSAGVECSPSRAGILPGRYPVRSGLWSINGSAVFNQQSVEGLPHSEVTIPEMLSRKGYKSALVGKWHLGVGRNREFLPLHHGFNDFFGLAGSHKDCPCLKCYFPHDNCSKQEDCFSFQAPCQLMHGNEIIEQPVNLITLASRQARAARSLIQKYSCENTPFFILYSFLHPHSPHFAGKNSRNSTLGGVYTDSLKEMDWQVGQVIEELKKSELIENTLIIFTSDNGPSTYLMEEGGFSSVFRGGKGSTYEGGSRVPTIAYWKSKIKYGISTELLSHLDIWPTLRRLSGLSSDDFNITLDGFDVSGVLLKNAQSRRKSLLYYSKSNSFQTVGPHAIRDTKYKIHFLDEYNELFKPPRLHNINIDPGEQMNLENFRESESIIKRMTHLWYTERSKVEYGENVLSEEDKSAQLCCKPGCEPFPSCCVCPSNYTKSLFPLSINCNLPLLPVNGHTRRKVC